MRQLHHFIRDRSGVAATEMAIGLPLLALVLAGVVGGWTYTTELLEMRKAVKIGANYVLQGGTDTAAAQSAVVSAWPNKPKDGAVAVTNSCSCAGTTNSCSTNCADGTAPKMSLVITASGSVDMPLCDIFQTGKFQMSRVEVIRVK